MQWSRNMVQLESPWLHKTAFPTPMVWPLDESQGVLTITRSRLLAHVWSGPYLDLLNSKSTTAVPNMCGLHMNPVSKPACSNYMSSSSSSSCLWWLGLQQRGGDKLYQYQIYTLVMWNLATSGQRLPILLSSARLLIYDSCQLELALCSHFMDTLIIPRRKPCTLVRRPMISSTVDVCCLDDVLSALSVLLAGYGTCILMWGD
jgi:hypothetical protein